MSGNTLESVTRNGCGCLAFVFFVFCGLVIWWGATRKPSSEPWTREDRIQRMFSSWDGAHPGIVSQIKAKMNDPDSFEHVETSYTDLGDSLIVVCQFRGKNAFGGVLTQRVRVEMKLNGQILNMSEFH